MKRDIIKIDEDKCTGCGICIPGCHEGALQIIDGKARLISDLMCDGLGACIGTCPEGAIEIEHREAEAYDEIAVIKEMITKGKNTVIAHLKHLKEHQETVFLKQGVDYLIKNKSEINFDVKEVISEVHQLKFEVSCKTGGCPGAAEQEIKPANTNTNSTEISSALSHWPVQLHLINPGAQSFKEKDLLIAADCTAYTIGNFHGKYLKDKALVIACPKLDSGLDIYKSKIKALIENAKVNTITVLIMEVPCCSSLLTLVQEASMEANRKVPIKVEMISIKGETISSQWI